MRTQSIATSVPEVPRFQEHTPDQYKVKVYGLTLQRESSRFTSSLSEKVRGGNVPPSSIIFIGDSVIRYQYLSLVYFLKNRHWIGRHQRPNPIEEQTYDSWEDFYNQTSKALTPYELCDCFRVDNPENFTLPFENRYFCGPGLKVSYIQAFGDFGSQGRMNITENPLPVDYETSE
ncbi:hypothetical protein CYMTET_51593 [Cymbomonas tetramitiformis]|uniref:Uncharacterized protein n=1 Tax=Cymbomonas tetramitiformis TaxID=36881 RepID=A0AAE0ES65_9CHLO|nr:hypothetical protein CYMTET_51593 [Cymbomonas tetramitiformis]